jgi:hypothetical protein
MRHHALAWPGIKWVALWPKEILLPCRALWKKMWITFGYVTRKVHFIHLPSLIEF